MEKVLKFTPENYDKIDETLKQNQSIGVGLLKVDEKDPQFESLKNSASVVLTSANE